MKRPRQSLARGVTEIARARRGLHAAFDRKPERPPAPIPLVESPFRQKDRVAQAPVAADLGRRSRARSGQGRVDKRKDGDDRQPGADPIDDVEWRDSTPKHGGPRLPSADGSVISSTLTNVLNPKPVRNSVRAPLPNTCASTDAGERTLAKSPMERMTRVTSLEIYVLNTLHPRPDCRVKAINVP